MRALPLAATALVAALTLTACSDSDGGDGGGNGDGDTGAKKAGSACVLDEMGVQVGPANAAPAAGDTGNVPITITNKSGAKCTLDGLPAVDLSTGPDSATVEPDEAVVKTKTTLAKGGVTSFTLTYVRAEAGDGLAVKTARFFLPGSTKAYDFKWSYGEVALKKDGQTPDASVSGFQQSFD
ncbi:DUF4232 domain-containing protein [Streptomyces sp. NPDC046909]|uniref:DUF4232 domain-containing protein n=1 Tax=Streptomyces sp. NPDC046909 TaxID=3155617 RepID=UPI0033D1AC50